MSTVAIIDDHRAFSDRLAAFVGALPGWSVVGAAEDAFSGVNLLQTSNPDVALIDVGLPGRNGFWVTEHALRRAPALRIILMSDGEPEEYADAAVDAGAVAYLPKRAISRELPRLLGAINDNDGQTGSPLPPDSAGSGHGDIRGTGPIAVATKLERSVVSNLNVLLVCGTAFLGLAAAGQPILGVATALALLILHRQGSPSRANRGRARGRDL